MADRLGSHDPVVLNLQTATGLPRSARMRSVTDPINPTPRTSNRLSHFFDGIYDLSPESHLSRLLKVILGDAGIGILSKQFTVARLNSTLLTTRYANLDRLYGFTHGYRRLHSETISLSQSMDNATPDDWDDIEVKDAAYRARIETFSRSLPLGATPDGMSAMAQSLLSVECRIRETYEMIDQNVDTTPPLGQPRNLAFGRTTNNRSEFIVVPKRAITPEEEYELIRVLTRFKPAGSLLTIAPQGTLMHTKVTMRDVHADSTYWEVDSKVAPRLEVSSAYLRVDPVDASLPVVQPRPAFSSFQGEAWSYNADVESVTSYTEKPDLTHMDSYNYQRVGAVEYPPQESLADPVRLLLGRSVSDGVLTGSAFVSSQMGVGV